MDDTTDFRSNVEKAIRSGRESVAKSLDSLASELEDTATRIRNLEDTYLDNPDWAVQSGTAIARELGMLLRQPLGQNAQEILLRDLASLSYDQGALQALKIIDS